MRKTRIVSDSSRFDFELYPRSRNVSPVASTIQESVSASGTEYSSFPYTPHNGRTPRMAHHHSNSELVVPEEHTLLELPKQRQTRVTAAPPRNYSGNSNNEVWDQESVPQNHIYDVYAQPSEYESVSPYDNQVPPVPPKEEPVAYDHFEPYPPEQAHKGPWEPLSHYPMETLNTQHEIPIPMKEELQPRPSINGSFASTKVDINSNFTKPKSLVSDRTSQSSKLRLEKEMIHKVMDHPLLSIPYRGTKKTITLSFVLHLLEILFAICVISLSSAMIKVDPEISHGVYIYFLVQASVLFITSILFICNIMNFERNNGIFYCLMCTILAVVSFGLCTAQLIPATNCEADGLDLCAMRKSISTFITISTFTWFSNLVTFLTIYRISKLNLLSDINFENEDFMDEQPLNTTEGVPPADEYYNEFNDLKEYYLNESGSLYEVSNPNDIVGKNKVILYTV